MDKIKVGVIGIGFIGAAHVEALRRIPGIEVAAIAHSSDEKAKVKGEELGIEQTYGDYRRLLESKEIDAVHICTPNHLHYSQTKDALAAGKHVLCEKPLAVTVKEAQELVKQADSSGRVTAVHFNIRFYPLMSHIKAMIASGELGEIYAVHGSYLQDWLFYDTDYNWRLEPDYSGESRAVADIGSHWMDLIEFLTGDRIAEVCADLATVFETRKKPLKSVETFSGKMLKPEDYEEIPIGTEDYATVLLHFAGGARGVFTVSQVSAGRKNRVYFEIDGSKKSVAWESELPNQMWIGRRDGPNELLLRDPSLVHADSRELIGFPGGHNEGFPDTAKQLCKRFYTAVRAGAPAKEGSYPTFADGLRELELCDTILRSNKKRSWLAVGK
jgi:predicted dehydrogenase